MSLSRRRVFGRCALPVGAWLLPAVRAQAHTTFPGLGGFAGGLLHPLATPLHLLVLFALGLWLGQRAPLRLKEPAAVFAGAAAIGLLWTVVAPFGGVAPAVLVAAGLCVGACVAVGASVHLWIKAGACGIAALLLGLDSGVEAVAPSPAVAKILFATWVGLLLCLVDVAFYVSLLPAVQWARIGVRVVGSWIVAIALLLLAFALRR